MRTKSGSLAGVEPQKAAAPSEGRRGYDSLEKLGRGQEPEPKSRLR